MKSHVEGLHVQARGHLGELPQGKTQLTPALRELCNSLL